MDVWVSILLRFVKARPAGEDNVRPSEQLLLELQQLDWCKLEFAKLVHRVIDGGVGFDVP